MARQGGCSVAESVLAVTKLHNRYWQPKRLPKLYKNMKLIINTDGGARGNPGPAGIGAVIKDEQGNLLFEKGEYIGETTNNQAEYKALIMALQNASTILSHKSEVLNLEIRMDSELIVKQITGEYKIKDPGLKILAAEVFGLLKNFGSYEFVHVRREFNSHADRLVNEALDSEMVN